MVNQIFDVIYFLPLLSLRYAQFYYIIREMISKLALFMLIYLIMLVAFTVFGYTLYHNAWASHKSPVEVRVNPYYIPSIHPLYTLYTPILPYVLCTPMYTYAHMYIYLTDL